MLLLILSDLFLKVEILLHVWKKVLTTATAFLVSSLCTKRRSTEAVLLTCYTAVAAGVGVLLQGSVSITRVSVSVIVG